MHSTMKKSDTELKKDVLAELGYEPSVKVTDIGVLVKDGAVTLNGYASNYGEKWDAVCAVRRVAGVEAIADDIEVKLSGSQLHADGDIAGAAAERIGWLSSVPKGAVEVTVREGCISLAGEVEWWYQKHAAETAVQYLAGVKGVTNLITIKPTLEPANVEKSIRSAFERNALLDSKRIEIEATGSTVTLRGTVGNYFEREEAERIAWAAPGVFTVHDHLMVAWPWHRAE